MKALFLIDLQLDFLSDLGRMPVGSANAQRVLATANELAERFEQRGWPVILIVNQFKRNDIIGNFFRKKAAIEGTEGARLDPRVRVREPVQFAKSRSSAFSNPDLVEYLRRTGVDDVVICGVYAEGCVRATALDAQRSGLRTTVITEGVASNRKMKYRWALSEIRKNGIRVLSLAEWLESG